MKLRLGTQELEFPSAKITELRESQTLLGDIPALNNRMAEDGYLFLRGLLGRDKVLRARETVLKYMKTQEAFTPNTPLLEAVMPKGGKGVPMMGRRHITHHDDLLAVLEGQELFKLFETYFSESALSFDYKWLRAVGNEAYTGAHMDFVYMGQGSQKLHTVWIPLGDIPVEQGTLAMCAGSNHLESFAKLRSTYGQMDVDRDGVEGWFSKEPLEITEHFGGQWQTTNFYAGDIIFFGMHTMHASTTNLTNRFRLSCDVRYQPASEPMDKRWREKGVGHTPHESIRSMEELRAEWGL